MSVSVRSVQIRTRSPQEFIPDMFWNVSQVVITFDSRRYFCQIQRRITDNIHKYGHPVGLARDVTEQPRPFWCLASKLLVLAVQVLYGPCRCPLAPPSSSSSYRRHEDKINYICPFKSSCRRIFSLSITGIHSFFANSSRYNIENMGAFTLLTLAAAASAAVLDLPVHVQNTYVSCHMLSASPVIILPIWHSY